MNGYQEQISREREEQRDRAALHFKNTIISLAANTECVIDTNIWMNEDYDPFFRAFLGVLAESSLTYTLYEEQWRELCNLKNNNEYDSPKSRRARCALSRIEVLQKASCLTIRPVNRRTPSAGYVDDLLLNLLRSACADSRTGGLVSDDRELRIRARQVLKDYGVDGARVVGGEELLPLAKAYCEKYNCPTTAST